MSFETKVFGKFILAGEHAVLRGAPALVFPVFGKNLSLKFLSTPHPLKVEFQEDGEKDVRLVFWSLIERALDLLGRSRDELKGEIRLENSIPVGAGLGASAALCVAVARFLNYLEWVKSTELQEFARSLEDLFHGESSGVDVAVAISGEPIWFERMGVRKSLKPLWKPNWYLSYSGQRGMTLECIERVKKLWVRSPSLGLEIDEEMKKSVIEAYDALINSTPTRISKLSDALTRSRSCFERWGLTQGRLESHMSSLMEAGAIAVKPTGSGGGGFVLSLWHEGVEPQGTTQFISI
jgi:mevalonate kinase